MRIHTELFGGMFDGKPIELDAKTLPMAIEIPYYPDIETLLNVANQVPSDNADKPLGLYKTVTYLLNNDGTYKVNK